MAILPETLLSLPKINIMGAFNSPITGVSIDTRSLNAGDLFVAFNGAQVDGHNFIPNAISRGASAVMASTTWDGLEHWESQVPIILTDDPVRTLADLATEHRKRFNIPVIAITGTNGKTSTKTLLSQLLMSQFSVLSTKGNFNNHIGLPITILHMKDSHEVAVVELGASQQGDIETLCNIAQPTQGLITNISQAHTEFFHNLDTIQTTKGELFEYLNTHEGTLFINSDDNRVNALAKTYNRTVHFGFSASSTYSYTMAGPDQLGRYSLHHGLHQAHLHQPGKMSVLNAAAAATVALENGIQWSQVQGVLEKYSGEKGRMEQLTINHVVFYNDAYNANPASTQAGFETMAKLSTEGRKVLIFADMLELGSESQMLHARIANQMLAAGFDLILLVGQEVIATVQQLQNHHFSSYYHHNKKANVIKYFLAHIEPGDLVYLKGSRSMQLEAFIKAYKENN